MSFIFSNDELQTNSQELFSTGTNGVIDNLQIYLGDIQNELLKRPFIPQVGQLVEMNQDTLTSLSNVQSQYLKQLKQTLIIANNSRFESENGNMNSQQKALYIEILHQGLSLGFGSRLMRDNFIEITKVDNVTSNDHRAYEVQGFTESQQRTAMITDQVREIMIISRQFQHIAQSLLFMSSLNFLRTNHHFPHQDYYLANRIRRLLDYLLPTNMDQKEVFINSLVEVTISQNQSAARFTQMFYRIVHNTCKVFNDVTIYKLFKKKILSEANSNSIYLQERISHLGFLFKFPEVNDMMKIRIKQAPAGIMAIEILLVFIDYLKVYNLHALIVNQPEIINMYRLRAKYYFNPWAFHSSRAFYNQAINNTVLTLSNQLVSIAKGYLMAFRNNLPETLRNSEVIRNLQCTSNQIGVVINDIYQRKLEGLGQGQQMLARLDEVAGILSGSNLIDELYNAEGQLQVENLNERILQSNVIMSGQTNNNEDFNSDPNAAI